MRLELLPHPESKARAVSRIDVHVRRSGAGDLDLRYVATGNLGNLLLPPPARPDRTDGLWKHTCFEAFIGTPASATYCEFNFSPSGQWAAYRFGGYRTDMAEIAGLAPPRIDVRPTSTHLDLQTSLRLNRLPDLLGAPVWRLGLSAVIEDSGGGRAYWALRHPPGKPDFHHAEGFACRLPVAETI